MSQKTRPYSSSSRATVAVSVLTTAAAVAAACATSSSSAAAQNSCCSESHPLLHVTAGSNNSGSSHRTNNNQAAELLLLQKIPRGGSSTEKNVSSSSKSKESKADSSNRSGGENKKRKKSKRGGGGGNSSKNNNKKNDTKQRRHSRSSKEAASASSETKGPSSTDTSSSEQRQEHDEEESTTTTNKLPPAAQSILSQTCHYDVLGITKSATQTEIQKAYRRRCVLTHPDKTNGDRSAFDKVSEAYDILSCENKRALYDRFGMEGLENGMMDGNAAAGAGAGGFFGANDVFREFFGGGMGSAGTSNFFGAQFNQGGSRTSSSSSSFGPRNRDLRYQLEVSLEDLYKGTTKHVAIQQPNPLRPHFPYRKEVEVTLSPGMHSGQSVRLSGVVDSIPDAAPADVVFLLKQRRHPIYTRRGSDLAMEVRITLAEAIVGYKKKIVTLDGSEMVIGNPYKVIHVKKEELVDAPSLPDILDGDSAVGVPAGNTDTDNSSNSSKTNTTTSSSNGATSTAMKEEDFPVQQIVKTTTLSYHLPSKIIQTGDVHVLKGKGMPKRRVGGHDYGDLYIQYIVELPGGTAATSASSSSFSSAKSKLDTKNLSPEERVELAKLLSKLEGKDDPTTDVMKVLDGDSSSNSDDTDERSEKGDKSTFVHRLVVSSASEFGRSSSSDDGNDYDDDDHHDDLHHHEEDNHNHHRGHMHDFFQRAFHGGGRSNGFAGPFGFGSTSGGGFRYFSSSSGNRHGGPVYGEEDDHQVECNQM